MKQSIVILCIRGVGHFQRLLPLIKALADRGCAPQVLTHVDFRAKVERAGGRFIDLFAEFPLEAADATSIPVPSRYVTFAGVYAERLSERIAALNPSLIIYDTFMVVAPVIARRLGVPYVNVCSGHAAVPSRVLAALANDPRVATSQACWQAVARLREVYGMTDAHPFSYVDALSPYLNLYGEPEEFLAEADRAAFHPIAFFGSLAPDLYPDATVEIFPRRSGRRRIYISFGTVIWWYFEKAALAALRVLADTSSRLDVDVVISLGGHRLDAEVRAELEHANVKVHDHVDQWGLLRDVDLFVTHHGLNSTHEAIFHQVPLVSYPFFGDQPAQARHCQELGLALPLTDAPQAAIAPQSWLAALKRLSADRAGFADRLAAARSWELRTIAAREAIVDTLCRASF